MSHHLTTHGLTKSAEYGIWGSMIGRCTRPNHTGYHRYGGAGIRVCERWMDSFAAFYSDMGARPSKAHSIDRIDGTRGYEPGNCRWATRAEQNRNKCNNIVITALGKTQTATDWARELQCNFSTIKRRMAALGGEVAIEELAANPIKPRRSAAPALNGVSTESLANTAGISRQAMHWRLKAGWPIDRAVCTPLRKR